MPKNIVVPIFDQADLDAVPVLISHLKAVRPQRVLLLQNPSVGVAVASVSTEFQQRIDALERDKAAAIQREDYDAARRLKEQIEGVKTERDSALSMGIQNVPLEQRNAAYAAVAEPFGRELQPLGVGVRQIVFSQDFQKGKVGIAIDSLSQQWPTEFPHGQYDISWPLNAVEPEKTASGPATIASKPSQTLTADAPTVARSLPPPPAKKEPETPEEWTEHYGKFYMLFVKDAKAFGIQVPKKGEKWKHLIPQVVEARFAAKAA